MVQLDNLLLTKTHTEATLTKLRSAFKTVHYYPDPSTSIPSDVLAQTDIVFTGGAGFHSSIKSLDDLPNLKHVQLHSAGANAILNGDVMKSIWIKGKMGLLWLRQVGLMF